MAANLKDSILKAILFTKKFVSLLLMAISPMALLMLIVAIIMFFDDYGSHQRMIIALDEVPLTATAVISSCYPEDRYCYVQFSDQSGRERFEKLDWRYYPEASVQESKTLTTGDQVIVRYANQLYASESVLAGNYQEFLDYRGYYYEMGGIALVCWVNLILYPEVMLFALVEDVFHYPASKIKSVRDTE
ncbi:MAG: hypothetical protein JXA13_01425 [Anaerolineales bacterium]|nr:hypothetical protein [Anaerolineales bacterium]